jgi:hypothetical protein
MSISLRTRHLAPWLAGLAAIVSLLLLEARETTEGRRDAELRKRFIPTLMDRHRSQVETARWDASQGSDAPFVEWGAEDHLDGRRDDPGYALIWHRQQHRIIERQYGYAIASLNLPDAESAKLADLLTARREAAADARDIAQQFGIVGPQAKVAVQQSVDALTDEIKQLVGSDAYFGRIELAPTISTCKALLESTVGLDLASQGDPLTKDQLYSAAEDFVGAVYSPAASVGPQEPDSSTGLTPQYLDFLDKVSGKLSAAQVSAFHDFLVKQVQGVGDSGAPSPTADNPE